VRLALSRTLRTFCALRTPQIFAWRLLILNQRDFGIRPDLAALYWNDGHYIPAPQARLLRIRVIHASCLLFWSVILYPLVLPRSKLFVAAYASAESLTTVAQAAEVSLRALTGETRTSSGRVDSPTIDSLLNDSHPDQVTASSAIGARAYTATWPMLRPWQY
jgi:hypothetical protein